MSHMRFQRALSDAISLLDCNRKNLHGNDHTIGRDNNSLVCGYLLQQRLVQYCLLH